MNKIILVMFFLLIPCFGHASVVEKQFVVNEYACYQNGLQTISIAINQLNVKADKWCKYNGGVLAWNVDPQKIEIIIYKNNSPLNGGCPGDVTLKASFKCLLI